MKLIERQGLPGQYLGKCPTCDQFSRVEKIPDGYKYKPASPIDALNDAAQEMFLSGMMLNFLKTVGTHPDVVTAIDTAKLGGAYRTIMGKVHSIPKMDF